jgi:hypothetical protein
MSTTFLAGHGQWNITDGYAEVPKGCSITFYTEFSKNLFTADMKAIIGGTFTGTPKLVVEEYRSCPNYLLSGDSVSLVACQQLLLGRNDPNLGLIMFNNGQVRLSEIFAYFKKQNTQTHFIWCACRYTNLKDMGGKTIGVNAAQGTYGNRNNLGQLANNLGTDGFYFNPSTANRIKPL